MFDDYRRRRAIARVKPGNGRPLKRFRWWQTFSRSLFFLPQGGSVYAVDVRQWQQFTTEDGKGKAQLYLNGVQVAVSTLPAVFEVPGGVIEVASSPFGLKRCHYVSDDGAERQLTPDPASSEGRRARLDRDHPGLSRTIGVLSVLLLLIPLALAVPQVLEAITKVPPIAERFGPFVSPVDLSAWQNIALGLVAAAASTERAARLRYNRLLDTVG
ncbi:hypothetical protein Aab01nite_52640 [Paractinoplanes abujensis]|uniref:Uncharacterized protein n=1 Tax=Paractinoplanes abujensis TaxID=882441 RepID=A0A7W7G2H7_9ACTN|nr:hypothetical protein [Actinoplanes abujensis]MBB4693669.1 hypothetical protein [Actinoplanes abujensis]GID21674.1 hypothetical protein Aab01nite_52640 [Actinoplanes abujensis]